MSLSRRTFLRFGAAAAAVPLLSEYRLALAQMPEPASGAPASERVLINFNENPAGPCAAAREAIAQIVPEGGRYRFDLADELVKTFAQAHGLKPGYVRAYAGSSEPLQYTMLAYTTPRRGLVAANLTYEAAWQAAIANGSHVIKVPLTKEHAHDVRAMAEADPLTAVIYICNPNNPSGTITPRADLEWMLTHKPKGSILLVDEAYIQYCDERSMLDLVAADKELVVLRTFSKIYGMAGLRCGFAAGRPDLLKKLDLYGDNPLPITAIAAAIASLKDADVVAQRKRETAAIRTDVLEWLAKGGYRATASASNCFMVDVGRPGRQVMDAMAAHGVVIGRTWDAWPNHVRVTIGTAEEMERFKSAFRAVTELKAAAQRAAFATGTRA
jgi:histidinol-phosphate aminotransferase